MKRGIYFSVLSICLSLLIYGCSKQSVEEKNEDQAIQSSSRISEQGITIDNYFTSEELEYLKGNFGSFDMNTVQQIVLNGEKLTTVCSELNNGYNFKRLLIQEKNVRSVNKIIKAIYSVKSSNETISNVLKNSVNPTQLLTKSVVSLNVGEIYTVDENGNFTEDQTTLRPPGQGFGTCFKTCYRDKLYGMNFVEAVICGYEIPACLATISAICTWDCL